MTSSRSPIVASTPWPLVELNRLCLSKVDARDPRREPDKSFTYIDIGSIDNVEKRIVRPTRIMGSAAPSRARQVIHPGDVLVATTRPSLNAVALVGPELNDEICSTGFCVLRAGEELDPAYLFCFVRSQEFVAPLAELVKGALYPAVTDQQVRSIRIPTPPIAEQRRIALRLADQLASAEQARSAAEAQLEAARKLTASFLRSVFESQESQSWQTVRLDSGSAIASGIQKSPSRSPIRNHHPYLTVRNVQRGYLDLDNIERFEITDAEFARLRLEVGDLLIVEGNGSLDHIGRNALYRGEPDSCIHQNHIIRCRLDRAVFRPEFVSLYLNSDAGKAQMVEKARPSSGLYTLSTGKVGSLEIPTPSLAEQQDIEAKCAEIASKADAIETGVSLSLDAIDKLPAALLRRAFNGEL